MPREMIKSSDYMTEPGSTVHVAYYFQMSTSWHSHEFYELVFVSEGFCMHHLGDSVFLVMEGDLLFVKPGVYHRYTGTRECRIINCLFVPEALDDTVRTELLALPGMSRLLLGEAGDFLYMHLNMTENKHLRKLLEQMAKECEEKLPGWHLKNRALLHSMLVDCSRIYAAHDGKRLEKEMYSGYVTHAMRYIDEHYAKNTLTVREVGEAVGISPDYLSRQFRKMTGIAVQEYLRRYRLSRAITCLQQGCSVGEAARKSGFHSSGYFSREFKKEMGISPSHYEEQQ